jgi:hypothetical protein
MAAMSNGNIDPGNKAPTRKPDQPAVNSENCNVSPELRIGTREDVLKTGRSRISAAMSEQCGDIGRGNQSTPQKFVQLVGCRDSKAPPKPWIRPRPSPQKP